MFTHPFHDDLFFPPHDKKIIKTQNMRYKLLFLLAVPVIMLVSCSKSKGSDEDDDNKKTTVNFTNTLNRALTNVKIGTWKGDGNPARLLRDVGNFAAGSSTGEIQIKDPSIRVVYFYYDETNGKTYMTDFGYGISQGTFNNWDINSAMHLMEISKSDDLYPR